MSKREYDVNVRFEFHTDLVGEEYKQFIYDLMKQFLYSIDSVSKREWLDVIAVNEHRWNDEGILDLFYINNIFISYVKYYLYDEMDNNFPKQIVFRDHYSESAVKRVFLVSDTFEKFLNEAEIDFSRHNLLR